MCKQVVYARYALYEQRVRAWAVRLFPDTTYELRSRHEETAVPRAKSASGVAGPRRCPREVPRFEEQRVILLCGQIVARVFHRDVAGRLTQMFPEGRRLADLASACHQHHFALFEHAANRWLYFVFYIHEMASLPRGHVLTLRQCSQLASIEHFCRMRHFFSIGQLIP